MRDTRQSINLASDSTFTEGEGLFTCIQCLSVNWLAAKNNIAKDLISSGRPRESSSVHLVAAPHGWWLTNSALLPHFGRIWHALQVKYHIQTMPCLLYHNVHAVTLFPAIAKLWMISRHRYTGHEVCASLCWYKKAYDPVAMVLLAAALFLFFKQLDSRNLLWLFAFLDKKKFCKVHSGV